MTLCGGRSLGDTVSFSGLQLLKYACTRRTMENTNSDTRYPQQEALCWHNEHDQHFKAHPQLESEDIESASFSTSALQVRTNVCEIRVARTPAVLVLVAVHTLTTKWFT